MSVTELERLEQELKPLVRFLGMVRVMVGVCFACLAAVIGGAIWVSNQTSAIAAHSSDIKAIIDDRKLMLQEWTTWRRAKDEADTKMIILLENQQRMLEAHQRWIERQ